MNIQKDRKVQESTIDLSGSTRRKSFVLGKISAIGQTPFYSSDFTKY